MQIPRLVRMHSDEMEDVESVGSGEIVAMFGVECHSGDTFNSPGINYAMTSMFVPEPVISYSVKPAKTANAGNFSKAINRFTKEDPTFRSHVDTESSETIISGVCCVVCGVSFSINTHIFVVCTVECIQPGCVSVCGGR